MGWNYYIPKPQKHTLKYSDLKEIKNMEIKDIWQILDDADIPSIYRFIKIGGPTLILKMGGIRIREPTMGLRFTPYLFYETDKDKENYKKFIKKLNIN